MGFYFFWDKDLYFAAVPLHFRTTDKKKRIRAQESRIIVKKIYLNIF